MYLVQTLLCTLRYQSSRRKMTNRAIQNFITSVHLETSLFYRSKITLKVFDTSHVV